MRLFAEVNHGASPLLDADVVASVTDSKNGVRNIVLRDNGAGSTC